MAVSQVTVATPASAVAYINSDSTGTKSAIKASSGTIYSITIDNTANASASYLKLYDAASGSVTVGTTAPDWIFKAAASVKKTYVMPEGIAFGTALTEATVTAGGTAGTTDPTSDVAIAIVYT